MTLTTLDDLVSLCKRRGFVFQSCDLYGGLKGVYDYGPLGVELKNNLKQSWWRHFVHKRDDIEGLDSSILSHELLFTYSGHVDGFHDPLVECKSCNARLRQDKMTDPSKCDHCGSSDLMEPKQFNMMFNTQFGPVDGTTAYLRAETCQAIFAQFKNVMDSTGRKPPFGIAQIGKAFRNEIIARNFVFRQREFEQLELEFFCEKGTDEQWLETWTQTSLDWWHQQGIAPEHLQLNDLPANDLPHYAKRTIDVEYKFPHGFDEIQSTNNRTDYDLGNHTKNQGDYTIDAKVKPNKESTTKLAVQRQEDNSWYIPYVVEMSMGLDRAVMAVLNEAYAVEELGEGKERIVLKLKPHLAPFKAAVVPLAKNKPELVEKARVIKNNLQDLGLGRVLFENTGNVGKAYRKHDEVGTPLCITVDFDTLEKGTVTVRNRDTMAQEIVPVENLESYVQAFYKENA